MGHNAIVYLCQSLFARWAAPMLYLAQLSKEQASIGLAYTFTQSSEVSHG